MEKISEDSRGFVVLTDIIPDLLTEVRYAGSYNFVGERIDGYAEAVALLRKEAAAALKEAFAFLKERGFLMKVYDAYRPVKAVEHFVRWAKDTEDQKMKQIFYPDTEKKELFARGYIALKSSHSRGSTVDVTLVDIRTGNETDMGCLFDFFGESSHSDYRDLTEEQLANRVFLKETMESAGFAGIQEEWWHFTLKDEPCPDTYFNFDNAVRPLHR